MPTRRERRAAFTDDQRVGLLEDDIDEFHSAIDKFKEEMREELGQVKQGQSKLTASALGLLISVVICTVSVLLTVVVAR
jgi:tetrahydromethanopterin S-methyltransferase subunit G